MNFRDWYTDTVDIWRVVPVQDGSLTRHERRELYRNIPCRLYQVEAPEVRMSQAAASASRTYAPLPPAPTTFLSPSGLSCRDWPTRKSVCSSRSG